MRMVKAFVRDWQADGKFETQIRHGKEIGEAKAWRCIRST